jgi:hypothetical protein
MHEPSIALNEPPEVGHFEPGGRHFEESKPLRAVEAAMLPVCLVAFELANDETFRRFAAEVAGDADKAYALAGRYCRTGGGREAVAAMLLEASRDQRPGFIATRLANLGKRRAAWLDAPLEPGDRRNALQERTAATYKLGALLLMRRGAGCCWACGALLASDQRGDYCSVHRPRWDARDKTALRDTLRAVAEHLGVATDGPASRRQRRGKRE